MSPRLKRLRKVLNPPSIKGFKPFGMEGESISKEPVLLHFEEYEALRLCDYDMLTHHEASVIMGVSRPTFTRIYAALRKKMASAFVEGRPIRIEGGKVYFDSNWFKCMTCACFFNNPESQTQPLQCPLCNSTDICNYDENSEKLNCKKTAKQDLCICPKCGHEQMHQLGRACAQTICPQCNHYMIRKKKSKNL